MGPKPTPKPTPKRTPAKATSSVAKQSSPSKGKGKAAVKSPSVVEDSDEDSIVVVTPPPKTPSPKKSPSKKRPPSRSPEDDDLSEYSRTHRTSPSKKKRNVFIDDEANETADEDDDEGGGEDDEDHFASPLARVKGKAPATPTRFKKAEYLEDVLLESYPGNPKSNFYDPNLIKYCQIYDRDIASPLIHNDYNKTCLPLENIYSIMTYNGERVEPGSIKMDFFMEEFPDQDAGLRNLISALRFNEGHGFANLARLDPRHYQFKTLGTGTTEYLYKKGTNTPAVFLTPGCVYKVHFLQPLSIKTVNGDKYMRSLDINLILLEGDRWVANLCITNHMNSIYGQIRKYEVQVEDDEAPWSTSYVTMSTKMGNLPSASSRDSESPKKGSVSKVSSSSKYGRRLASTSSKAQSSRKLPSLNLDLNTAVPVLDLMDEKKPFSFPEDLQRISQFSSWPDAEPEEESAVIVAHTVSRYKNQSHPSNSWDMSFNLCWVGVLMSRH